MAMQEIKYILHDIVLISNAKKTATAKYSNIKACILLKVLTLPDGNCYENGTEKLSLSGAS